MIEYVTDMRAASNAPTPETLCFFSMVQGLENGVSDLKWWRDRRRNGWKAGLVEFRAKQVLVDDQNDSIPKIPTIARREDGERLKERDFSR